MLISIIFDNIFNWKLTKLFILIAFAHFRSFCSDHGEKLRRLDDKNRWNGETGLAHWYTTRSRWPGEILSYVGSSHHIPNDWSTFAGGKHHSFGVYVQCLSVEHTTSDQIWAKLSSVHHRIQRQTFQRSQPSKHQLHMVIRLRFSLIFQNNFDPMISSTFR